MSIFKWTLIYFILFFAVNAAANTRRITDYGYDNAGKINIVDIVISEQPPQITELLPSSIRIGQQGDFIAKGSGLLKVRINTDSSGLIVSDLSSDNDQANFKLSANEPLALGEHALTFSTPLGFTTKTIIVNPALPRIALNPAPITLALPGVAVTLDIQLSSVDIIDHVINLSIVDATVAALTETSVTIAAGQTRPNTTIAIDALLKGSTTLKLSAPTLADLNTRLFVTDPYILTIGSHNAFAKPLGIIRQQSASPSPLPVRGPFYTQLGLVKSTTDSIVQRSINTLLSPSLTLTKGAVIYNTSQSALIAGDNSTEIVITGSGLENVDNVEILPADGITIDSLIVAADGTRVSFTVTVGANAVFGTRKIILSQQGSDIFNTSLTSTLLTIARGLPEITSLNPVVVTRFSTNTIVINGDNFQTTRALTITPSEGISSSLISVNAQGTQITATIVVDELAELGQRLVQVNTTAGMSSQVLSPANILTIINGPSQTISLLTAPVLGVNKVSETAESMGNINIGNTPIGVVHGSHVGGLSPQFEAIGAAFDLTINGSGLNDVVSVAFIPDDSIFVGIPIVAEDGLSLVVAVAIDEDADKTLRQVVVHTIDNTITASTPSADRFQVTDVLPVVISLSPNFLVTGDDFITLKIRGQMLNATTAVFAVPDSNIIINSPQVNAGGTEITVGIKALSGAETGVRAIVVETAGGESSDLPTPANSITIVSNQPNVFKALVSPLLGIDKTNATTPVPTRNLFITANLLGLVRETTTSEATTIQTQYTNNLSVLRGSAVTSTSPRLAPIDSALTLTVNGQGLDQVIDLSIEPSDGVVLSDDFSVNNDGTQLTVSIDIASDAALTQREITLATAFGELPFVNTSDRILRITGISPIIESISPIQQFPGTSQLLTVRGVNLNNVIAIEANPAIGDIIFGSISVNSEGTELQVPMIISPSATPGPQVIIITTLAGATSNQATPANTFTILALP